MKQLKNWISTYKTDRQHVKISFQTLDSKTQIFIFPITMILTSLIYLPFVLLITNLSIFVELHLALIICGILIALSMPYIFLILYYWYIKHYANETIFDRIGRLVIINGTVVALVIAIVIGFLIKRYGGLL